MSEVVDLEVGRYALRTFKVARGQVRSLAVSGRHWSNGVCKAECLAHDRATVVGGINRLTQRLQGSPDYHVQRELEEYLKRFFHDAPDLDCSCGIYGSLTLDHLKHSYPEETDRLLAVFAAEGRTIIGTRGLRTQFARVVAYWCPCWYLKGACRVELPKAERYRSLNEMLDAYDIPRDSDQPEPHYRPGGAEWWTGP